MKQKETDMTCTNIAAGEHIHFDVSDIVIPKADGLLSSTSPLSLYLARTGLTVAGGFLRDIVASDKPKDIDFWLRPEHDVEYLVKQLPFTPKAVIKTDQAWTVIMPDDVDDKLAAYPRSWQFILKWRYTSIHDVIDDFDFVCCKMAMRTTYEACESAYILAHGHAVSDCNKKILHYSPPVFRDEVQWGSLFRASRLMQRGWVCDSTSLLSLAARTVHGPGTDWLDTSDQLCKKFSEAKEQSKTEVLY